MSWEGVFIKKTVDLVFDLGRSLVTLRQERRSEIDDIEGIFGPTDDLVNFYVTPDGQNVNPADLAEDETGFVSRQCILEMFANFIKGPERVRHAFILADAGMGKSSLLVMLNLFHLEKFWVPEYSVQLFKLGPDTLDCIRSVRSPSR
ncbi:MAG: hypothetical protein H7835_20975, partial [Magnetococcus sp. XQGC-1]